MQHLAGSKDTQMTSALWLTKKVERDKLATMYRYLNVRDNSDLDDIDWFKINKIQRQTILIRFFWQEELAITC